MVIFRQGASYTYKEAVYTPMCRTSNKRHLQPESADSWQVYNVNKPSKHSEATNAFQALFKLVTSYAMGLYCL